jgi:uncharacterized protein YcnI
MRRKLLLLALATAVLTLTAAPALAHVTVNPGEAPRGGFTELTFRVPSERDDAATTKVEVTFPAEQPLAFVSVHPVPGWTVKVDREKLAKPIETDDGQLSERVSRITWSGGRIEAGQYENFSISCGPLPETGDTMVFKAVQTYSNGEVVRWIQESAPGQAEPESPAPTLTLTAPAAEGAATTPAAGGGTVTQADVDAAGQRATIGIVLGTIGLILGALGFLAGMRRRTAPNAPSEREKAGTRS